MDSIYRLVVTHNQQICLFELSWGDGQHLITQLPYPSHLIALYQRWQRAYLGYYQVAFNGQPSKAYLEPRADLPTSPLRARKASSGSVSAPVDWHSQLVQSEAKLLTEFHRWLRSEPLYPIRCQLGTPATDTIPTSATTLLITCTTVDLARLPWETWEVSPEFGHQRPIRIARLPTNVYAASQAPKRAQRKARILVIIGDSTGLDFSQELQQIKALKPLADIQTIGWTPNRDTDSLLQTICTTITDAQGWDLLFFFGHSNEAEGVGGEIAIAPQTALSMQELTPYLKIAQQQGLQFALFNSCKGLDIAEALVGLGLNQVVVMREPIHNRVAGAFLSEFLQHLAQFQTVHHALQKACRALRSDSNLTYPSAHLVPSLFCHRGATLFQLQPVGWKSRLSPWWPTRRQGIALGAIALLSCIPSWRDTLLNQRLYLQARYREVTHQIPDTPPPVVLVHIDRESVDDIPDFKDSHLDRSYLAQLIDKIAASNAQVIGIDYLFDRQRGDNDAVLANAFKALVDQQRWLINGTVLDGGKENGPVPEIAALHWSMQGYINAPWYYLRPPSEGVDCGDRCPFAYLLALTHAAALPPPIGDAHSGNPDVPKQDLRQQLLDQVDRTISTPSDVPPSDVSSSDVSYANPNQVQDLKRLSAQRLHLGSRFMKQRWLQPIIDYSLPPNIIYDRIPAHELLARDTDDVGDWSHQVVLVGSGGYKEAGPDETTKDYLDELPPAVAYWSDGDRPSQFTGVEVHTYAVHHFLQRHTVVPVPTLWMLGLVAFIGAGTRIVAHQRNLSHRQCWLILCLLSTGYGVLGLQAHISVSIVLPWLLPTAVVWVYHIPWLNEGRDRPS